MKRTLVLFPSPMEEVGQLTGRDHEEVMDEASESVASPPRPISDSAQAILALKMTVPNIFLGTKRTDIETPTGTNELSRNARGGVGKKPAGLANTFSGSYGHQMVSGGGAYASVRSRGAGGSSPLHASSYSLGRFSNFPYATNISEHYSPVQAMDGTPNVTAEGGLFPTAIPSPPPAPPRGWMSNDLADPAQRREERSDEGEEAPADDQDPRRPTTALVAALQASPYNRVGSQRRLLELLKLRQDVAVMRARQSFSPIYRELKVRGASVPAGIAGGDGSETLRAIQAPKANRSAEAPVGTTSVPLSQLKRWGEYASRGTETAGASSSNLSISGIEPTGIRANEGACRSHPLPVEPSTSNVLPPTHQAAVQKTTEVLQSLPKERTEGELEDELARLSFDAVGLTPVLASCMPTGRYVVLNLLTTWGDSHEVGLCGVEFYNERGEAILPLMKRGENDESGFLPSPHSPQSPMGGSRLSGPFSSMKQSVSIHKNLISIIGCSADGSLRVLVEYSATPGELNLYDKECADQKGANSGNSATERIRQDPRRQVASIMDGVVHTHDESHMLAVPYTPGHHHLLCFAFSHPVTISMIRIHNYCGRGRAQTFKGARIVEITVDDAVMFRGEVKRHSGVVASTGDDGSEAWGDASGSNYENILFTEEESVLRRIISTQHQQRRLLREVHSPCDADSSADGDALFSSAYPVRKSLDVNGGGATTRVVLRHVDYSDDGEMGREAPMTCRTVGEHVARSRSNEAVNAVVMSKTAPANLYSGLREDPTSSSSKLIQYRASFSTGMDEVSGGNLPFNISVRSGSPRGAPLKRVCSDSELGAPLEEIEPRQVHSDSMTSLSNPRLHHNSKKAQYPAFCPQNVRSVCFMFLATWGEPDGIGLSGLRFRGANGSLIKEAVHSWRVQYPDGSHASPDDVASFAHEVSFLFDENPRTACKLPFQPGMQLVIVFENVIPSLGFLEVANFSMGGRTFCGVKEVRLFLSQGSDQQDSQSILSIAQNEIDRFRELWTFATSKASRAALEKGGVLEVTPPGGVSLRKAPAHISIPRFQTYDLSLESGAAGEPVDAWGEPLDPEQKRASQRSIGIGPGTGGAFHVDGVSGLGGGGGGYFTTSFANSLNASMNIRAAMAMKRARMAVRERPDWLQQYQPYLTPLLPVGYVCKVRLYIHARNTGPKGETGSDEPSGSNAAGAALKAYMKEWVVHPFRSCSFINENGDLILPLGNGSGGSPGVGEASSGDSRRAPGSSEEPYCIPIVVESVISKLNKAHHHHNPYQSQLSLEVMVDLVYVADIPFCLAVLCLNTPLVLDGAAAWVNRVQVLMDDAMIFDSGEATVSIRPRSSSSSSLILNESRKASTLSGGSSGDVCLPPCVSSLRPYILFTLDANVLDEVQRKIH